VRYIVVHIVHGNARRVRSRARHLRSRARIAKALRRIGIDAHSPRASGVGGAAGALDGELPVSAVGLVALGERGVSRAGVGCWCGMATALELASLMQVKCGGVLRCPTRRHSWLLAVGVRDCERVADHAAAPSQADPAEGVGDYRLQYDVVGLAGGHVGWSRYAVDDVRGECCSCLGLGEGEASILVNVQDGARFKRQGLGRRLANCWDVVSC
jgi:hypothetical protein